MRVNNPHFERIAGLNTWWRGQAIMQSKEGIAGVLEADGRPIVIGGMIPAMITNAEVWMLIDTQAARRHTLALIRWLRLACRTFGNALEAGLIYGWVQSDYPAARRLAELCGFHQEADIEGFGPGGCDMALYVRRPREWR